MCCCKTQCHCLQLCHAALLLRAPKAERAHNTMTQHKQYNRMIKILRVMYCNGIAGLLRLTRKARVKYIVVVGVCESRHLGRQALLASMLRQAPQLSTQPAAQFDPCPCTHHKLPYWASMAHCRMQLPTKTVHHASIICSIACSACARRRPWHWLLAAAFWMLTCEPALPCML